MAAVTMLHPASDRVQQASRDAFERVWQHEGWVLLEQGDATGVKATLQAGEKVLSRSEAAVAGEPSVPGPRDGKAAWVEWAVANGADRSEADAMTKKDLIAAFDE